MKRIQLILWTELVLRWLWRREGAEKWRKCHMHCTTTTKLHTNEIIFGASILRISKSRNGSAIAAILSVARIECFLHCLRLNLTHFSFNSLLFLLFSIVFFTIVCVWLCECRCFELFVESTLRFFCNFPVPFSLASIHQLWLNAFAHWEKRNGNVYSTHCTEYTLSIHDFFFLTSFFIFDLVFICKSCVPLANPEFLRFWN